MADPKAQARMAQEAAARAKAAAKEAAVASAKAEAKAEAQPASSNAGIVGSAVGIGATGIAANVPLDVFTQAPSARVTEQPAERTSDLSNEQQRMADSRGTGVAGAAGGKKIGETEDPDTSTWQRPGAGDRPAGPRDFADHPLGDRAAALRDGPESESENPLDSFGRLDDRGADLRAATGQGGGLNAMADRLHAGPQSGQGQGLGKEAIADGDLRVLFPSQQQWFLDSMRGRTPGPGPREVLDFPEIVIEGRAPTPKPPPPKGQAPNPLPPLDPAPTPNPPPPEGQAPNPLPPLDPPPPKNEAPTPPPPPPPEKDELVVQPVDQDGSTLPPGWIGGDAILPPGLRTGAAVGGAKGNDGVDWANQRWGASNPDPNASGGGGRPSAGAVWRQSQTNESLVGQPTGEASDRGGGGSGLSWAERQKRASNPTDDQNPEYGKGPEESEAVNTDPNQGNLAHLWESGDDDSDLGKASVRLITVRSDDDSDQDD